MALVAPVRTIRGREIPAAGVYEIDPSHSTAQFVVSHLVVAKIRGRFADLAGTVHVGEDAEQSAVAITLQAFSIDTADPQRDEHLRSPDFLDVERFPTLEYRSSKVEAAGNRWKVSGELTVRDVTRTVTLDVEYNGSASDPWGGQRAVFSASTEIDRQEFGLTWNVPLESGGVLVGNTISIEIEVEAVRR
jgi:polyisoprenoid-binding protein YceI